MVHLPKVLVTCETVMEKKLPFKGANALGLLESESVRVGARWSFALFLKATPAPQLYLYKSIALHFLDMPRHVQACLDMSHEDTSLITIYTQEN